MDLCKLTALELGALLRSGEIGSKEVLQAARPDHFNAFIAVNPSPTPARGDSPLAGVPMAYKDNICVRGTNTTCGSKLLANFISPYDATVVERLTAGGAVSLGKINMDEFAVGSSGESSYFGPTENPWDRARTPGGSSSGSAAAVAGGQVWYTLGSDTGGSVRLPAAYCGITGFKPSYGVISRYGVVPHAPSLDQLGPMARSAADCAAVLDLLSGRDPRDSTSVDLPKIGPLDGDLRGKKIGMPDECFTPDLDSQVAMAIEETAAALRTRGATVERCSLPALGYAADTYVVLSTAEISSNLSRFDAVRYGVQTLDSQGSALPAPAARAMALGGEVKRRILLGSYFLSSEDGAAYLQKARKAQSLMKDQFHGLFQKYDLLLTPTAASTAPLLGDGVNPDVSRLSDRYTVCANLAGLPAISIPCGFDRLGLPMGAQLIGPRLGDSMVLGAAHGYQQDTSWHRATPWD